MAYEACWTSRMNGIATIEEAIQEKNKGRYVARIKNSG